MRGVFNEDLDDQNNLRQFPNSSLLPNPINSLMFAVYKLFTHCPKREKLLLLTFFGMA